MALQRGLLALFEEIVKHTVELVRHNDETSTPALRGSELTTNERTSDVDAGFSEVHILPLQAEGFASSAPRRGIGKTSGLFRTTYVGYSDD